jgi:eukaryotic-like serine/threonine-protein kinase
MGEVYRACDTKLDRDVAIKVLPELFVSDPERVARFQREAKTLAALNHPHIGGIYGLEDAGGMHALVLELVEGPTLADRIAQGPIPLDEALPIARQIAEALEAAHEQGIIHRDLKPANIKVRPDGVVKVLDFGLAKIRARDLVGQDFLQLATETADATRYGVILGTTVYMSPEQARGFTIDQRTDVWPSGVSSMRCLLGDAHSVATRSRTRSQRFSNTSQIGRRSRVPRPEPSESWYGDVCRRTLAIAFAALPSRATRLTKRPLIFIVGRSWDHSARLPAQRWR